MPQPRTRRRRPEVLEGLAVARTLRQELELADDQPVTCVVDVAERRLDLDVVLVSLRAEVSGLYYPLRPNAVVVVSADHPVARQRFTLAHEIGHHALGHGASPRIQETTAVDAAAREVATDAAVDSSRDHYTPQFSTDPDERAANAFAGEFLVPEAGAAQLIDAWVEEDPLDQVLRLSAHYGVSAFSALVKFQMLGLWAKPEVDDVRARLQALEHVPRYGDLGLTPLVDELERHHAAGGGTRCSSRARASLARLRAEADAAGL
ncbi:MAG: ImmA/IrrE family metallo-endopeptidase [Solirubrobacteraceae bacterium]